MMSQLLVTEIRIHFAYYSLWGECVCLSYLPVTARFSDQMIISNAMMKNLSIHEMKHADVGL